MVDAAGKMKKSMFAIAMLCGLAVSAQTPTPDDGSMTTEASLALAKKVCAVKDGASVWVFNAGDWHLFSCAQLGEVFAIDKENPFDDLIPLMQQLHSVPKKKGAK